MKIPETLTPFLLKAKELAHANERRELIFSEGTYQVEIQDVESYWPFLQFNEEGELVDFFCSCKESEEKGGCPHLAAAYLRITRDGLLHHRFKDSFFSALFELVARRVGYQTKAVHKEGDAYIAYSKTKKRLAYLKPLSARSKKKLQEYIDDRKVETEETSLKFSNLTTEELEEYKEGRAPHYLRYELSFWSDLAKWMFCEIEEGASYTIDFSGSDNEIPCEVKLSFEDLECSFYIPRASFPQIIPTLKTVNSPLKVLDTEGSTIEKIHFNPNAKELEISHKGEKTQGKEGREGISLGEWLYEPGRGFSQKNEDDFLKRDSIPSREIGYFLQHYRNTAEKYLDEELHSEIFPLKYHLFFDKEYRFHIQAYLFTHGDLVEKNAGFFPPFAYLPNKGFYEVDPLHFEKPEKVVSRDELSEFINKHRIWLHQFEGFQTHFGNLEAHLTFELSDEGELSFDSEFSFAEDHEKLIDLGRWVFIKGRGFYLKKDEKEALILVPGLKVTKDELSAFIAKYKDELMAIEGFFARNCPLEKVGLHIFLDEEEKIHVQKEMVFVEGYSEDNVRFFSNFTYVEGEGFYELTKEFAIPDRYQKELIIPPSQELFFINYEIERLRPFITHIDPRLQRPTNLKLKVRRLIKERKQRKDYWIADLYYQSEIGATEVVNVWEEMIAKKKVFYSSAGLLFLKDPRFNWLSSFGKRKLHRKHKQLRLTSIEWMRLTIMEDLQEPEGSSKEAKETRALMREVSSLEAVRLLDISTLKSTLRPYQELGLQWLWFLYCHGLAGILADEMGLGKTHQAMALLSAVTKEDRYQSFKYLVVCPTSVIYHWQDLLERYLPSLRVLSYHGVERSLDNFEEKYDLLLTSYGILRTGKDNLKGYQFEVAIFDEIQVAKNHLSQTHRSLRDLKSNMKLGLTGTPIENRIRELKSLFDIVLSGYLPSEKAFRELFVLPIEKAKDPEAKKLLNKMIKPFILRRKKVEVLLDLPEKIEEISYCDLSSEQEALYQEILASQGKQVLSELKENKEVSYSHVFSLLTSLKQVCDHPSLLLKDPKSYMNHESGKWELFVELLNEARESNQKIVIFSQYLDMIAIIESYLKKKGIGYASIKGSTRDRKKELRKFKEDPRCEVFVASLLAAGVGIDLSSASIVIHYDRWWNPAKEEQATDRVHRIGQNRGVQVFKLVTKHTIEEHIHALIDRKKGLIEETLGKDDADQIRFLTREELMEVLQKTKNY